MHHACLTATNAPQKIGSATSTVGGGCGYAPTATYDPGVAFRDAILWR